MLGSTGSIGLQSLDVARKHGLDIQALAAHSSYKKLAEQAREFSPRMVCIYDEKYYNDLKSELADTDIKILCGMEGLCEIASDNSMDILLNSVVGMVGLLPTLTAIESGKDIALAAHGSQQLDRESVIHLFAQIMNIHRYDCGIRSRLCDILLQLRPRYGCACTFERFR